MFINCRTIRNQISTVRFKRPLTLAPTSFSGTYETQTSSNQTLTLSHLSTPSSNPTHVELSRADSVPFFCSVALKAAAKMGSLCCGEQIHALVIKSGLCNVLSLNNQILDVYVKSKQLSYAHKLFDEMSVRNVVTWNTLIYGSLVVGRKVGSLFRFCVTTFRGMRRDGLVYPDHLTFTAVLSACVELGDVEIGRQLHCYILKFGFYVNCFVSNGLIGLYGKLGLVEDAKRVFCEASYRDLAVWNAMLSCYLTNYFAEEGFELFHLMRLEGLEGDEYTFSQLISSAAALGLCQLGRQIQGLVLKLGFGVDVQVASSVVDMCSKNGYIGDAHKAFEEMPMKNAVSWTTIVVGYGLVGNGKGAMKCFRDMLQTGFHPDELTIPSVISSCGKTSASCEIAQVHAHSIKFGFQSFLSVGNSLINGYSMCGNIKSASQCFKFVSEPDIVTWTSMIRAYGFHGLAKEAIEIFEMMLSYGTRPDSIAFLAVLSACCHAGLVHEGFHYFSLMNKKYQLVPDTEHYACIINLAGRTGLLNYAYDLLVSIPKLESSTLGAFIDACNVHGDTKLAKEASQMLFSLEPNRAVNYALLSNVYASEGKWLDVSRVRKEMRGRCGYKVPGFSWMEAYGDGYTLM